MTTRMVLFFVSFLILSTDTGVSQTRGELFKLHRECRFEIQSQKVLNTTDFITLETHSKITVVAKAECSMLTFGIEYTRINNVKLDGNKAGYVLEEDLIGIETTKTLNPGDRTIVEIEMTLDLPDTFKSSPYTEPSPFTLPIDAVLNFPVEWTIRVPPGNVALTPGALIKSDLNADYSEFVWQGRWRPRVFRSLLVQGNLHKHRVNNIDFFLASSINEQALIDNLFTSITGVYFYLEDLWGPRPTKQFAIAQSPAADVEETRFNLGGIICLQTCDFDDPDDPWFLGCLAHEIAHEWWGGIVSRHDNDNQSLIEVFAEYSSICFGENKYGLKSVIDDVIVNTICYLEGDRKAISETNDRLYSKSILIPRLLMYITGEKAFYQTARQVLMQYENKPISFREFFSAAEGITGKKLQWMLDWLYYTDKDLDLSIDSVCWTEKNGKHLTSIKVIDRLGRFNYPLEVPIQVKTLDNKIQYLDCHITRQGTELSVKSESPVVFIAIDPNWLIWDTDRSNNFFGTHILSSEAQPQNKAIAAQLVGGFQSEYHDRIMTSLWFPRETSAHLISFADRTIEREPDLLWSRDGKEIAALFEATPPNGIIVTLFKEGHKISELNSDAEVPDWLQKRFADKVRVEKQIDALKHAEIINYLTSDDQSLIKIALKQIDGFKEAKMKNPEITKIVPPIFQVLKTTQSEEIREISFEIIWQICAVYHVEACSQILKNNLDVLLKAVEDKNFCIRSNVACLLFHTPDKKAVEPLCRSLVMDPHNINSFAIDALVEINDPRAVPFLIEVLESKDLWDRVNAADALLLFEDRRAIKPLIKALQNEDPSKYNEYEKSGMGADKDPARSSYMEALSEITGKDVGRNAEAWIKWWSDYGNRHP